LHDRCSCCPQVGHDCCDADVDSDDDNNAEDKKLSLAPLLVGMLKGPEEDAAAAAAGAAAAPWLFECSIPDEVECVTALSNIFILS
jgi:hypothetical protein